MIAAQGVLIRVGEHRALVAQLLEGLLGRDMSQVVEHLVPEARIKQVQDRVLGTAHVEINRLPLLFRLLGPGLVLGLRVEVAQVVPAGSGPLGHGVGFASGRATAGRAGRLDPGFDPGQGRLACAGGLVALHLGQGHGQRRFRHRHRAVGGTVNDGNRLAPVALPRKHPIAQPVADHGAAQAAGFKLPGDLGLGLGCGQAVEIA